MEFFDAVIRYETRLWAHLERTLTAETGGSLAVLEALRVVADHPGAARVAELQRDLGITVGAASKLVDRLERDSLVDRRANPDDRRSSLLELTSTGRSTLERDLAIVDAALAEHLGASDVSAVLDLLPALSSRFEAVR
jgi:DNA-binding MarR family transcriptional regulator